MRRIVQDILEAEARVSAVLEQARQNALEKRRAAEQEISEQMSAARREGREIVRQAVEEARREAERMRVETLERADRQGSALFGGRTEAIEDVVSRICTIVLSTEGRADNR